VLRHARQYYVTVAFRRYGTISFRPEAMLSRTPFVVLLALAAWWILVLPGRAEAYIDPSAGGMLVQLVLAGTAGVAVLAKLFWSRIKGLFGIREPEHPPDPSAEHKLPDDRI
jgi:hypothetical protein